MVKDFKNKIDGSGEKHIKYSLYFQNHIITRQFDTKEELKEWIKEYKEWIKELHSMHPYGIFNIVKHTEIYASKSIGILHI